MTPQREPARRLTRLCSLAVLAVLSAVLLTACGGSSHPSGSGSSGSNKAFTASSAYKYPKCMRAHGVTNFPDPQVSGNSFKLQITPSISGSPAFASALKACAYLLPTGAGQNNGPSAAQRQARTQGMLAFAACIRQHGFPSFPDPTRQGVLTLAMIKQAGINLQQPAVLQAGNACVPVSQGQITKGDVAQAIAGTSGSQGPGG